MPIKLFRIITFSIFVLFFFKVIVHANFSKEIHTLHHYHFSTPVGLESKVNFWKKIYSEYSTNHVVIHDMDNLDIIYEVAYFGDSVKQLSDRQKERKLDRIKKKYRKILVRLARTKDHKKLNLESKRIYNLVKSNFKKASRRIRVQVGQKDRFKEGLERSGLYNDQIENIFKDAKLPLELAMLPHVESSFQVNAYSSAGAAGIWQFTRGTGRLFMKVGYDIDERRDPILSSIAAAKLLKINYENLQSWPLAITAYNHGTQGMKRAKQKHGLGIVNIINKYRSRTFGFASKNFYAEFLAAMYVVQNSDKFFPGLQIYKPQKMSSVKFTDYIHVNSIVSNFGMSRDEVFKYNPALRKPVITGQKRIPRGFIFQAPESRIPQLNKYYKKIPISQRYSKQIKSKWHTVRRGDTLSGVAKRFRTTVNKLYAYNNLNHRNKIYVGQVLRLPGRYDSIKSLNKKSKRKKIRKKYSEEAISYRVRRNDNLTKIARRFEVEIDEVLRLNQIYNADKLFPGQILKISRFIPVDQKIKKSSISSKPKKQRSKKSDIKILRAHDKSTDEINKNRPAFLPVSFLSNANNSSEIGVITVDFDETLSHYAEWGKLPIKQILRINGLRNKSRLNIHSKIKVPFTNTDPASFAEMRQEYHKAIQEDFFNNYRIERLLIKNISKGQTVWEICNDIYSIPFWLLASYNPDKEINELTVGEPLVIPIISPVNSG